MFVCVCVARLNTEDTVTVTLLACKGLSPPEGSATANVYVTLTVCGDTRNEYTSKAAANNGAGSAEWGDVDTPLVLVAGAKMPHGFAADPYLRLKVFAAGASKSAKPTVLGLVKIPLEACEAGLVHDMWQPLLKCSGSPEQPAGELRCFVKIGRAGSFALPALTLETWALEKDEKAVAKKAALEKKRQEAAEKELQNELAANKTERWKNEKIATKVAATLAKDAEKRGEAKPSAGDAAAAQAAAEAPKANAAGATTSPRAKSAAAKPAGGAKVTLGATLKDATVASFDHAAQQQFIHALAASLGVAPAQIKLSGMRPGSLVVDVEVSGLVDDAAAAKVAAAAQDPAALAQLAAGLEAAGLGGVELSAPLVVTEDAATKEGSGDDAVAEKERKAAAKRASQTEQKAEKAAQKETLAAEKAVAKEEAAGKKAEKKAAKEKEAFANLTLEEQAAATTKKEDDERKAAAKEIDKKQKDAAAAEKKAKDAEEKRKKVEVAPFQKQLKKEEDEKRKVGDEEKKKIEHSEKFAAQALVSEKDKKMEENNAAKKADLVVLKQKEVEQEKLKKEKQQKEKEKEKVRFVPASSVCMFHCVRTWFALRTLFSGAGICAHSAHHSHCAELPNGSSHFCVLVEPWLTTRVF
jgi:hypothetical protein